MRSGKYGEKPLPNPNDIYRIEAGEELALLGDFDAPDEQQMNALFAKAEKDGKVVRRGPGTGPRREAAP